MAIPDPIPSERLVSRDFLADCRPRISSTSSSTWVTGTRSSSSFLRIATVPVAHLSSMSPRSASCPRSSKHSLGRRCSRSSDLDLFPVVIGTHPHEDHIGGMPEFIERFGDSIREYWEPGYYHPGPGYMGSMRALELRPRIQHSQPTSGFTRFIGQVKVVVLAPAIGLRNNFDSYGVNINNASIALKLEFPAARVEQRDAERRYLRLRRTQGVLLGADAQTLSWGRVMADFPELRPSESPVAKALRMALGADPLRAQVFKVPHHASKHGVSLELVELIEPDLTLISSAGGGGKVQLPAHGRPGVSRAKHWRPSPRRASRIAPTTTLGSTTPPPLDTRRRRSALSRSSSRRLAASATLWRFGDRPSENLDLAMRACTRRRRAFAHRSSRTRSRVVGMSSSLPALAEPREDARRWRPAGLGRSRDAVISSTWSSTTSSKTA